MANLMAWLKDAVQWRTASSEPITVGNARLTFQSQALVIRTPIWKRVWNRPVAVLVERDGQMERLPIVDVTRVAIVALAAGTVGSLLAVGLAWGLRRRAARATKE